MIFLCMLRFFIFVFFELVQILHDIQHLSFSLILSPGISDHLLFAGTDSTNVAEEYLSSVDQYLFLCMGSSGFCFCGGRFHPG